jgi:hypothetical protein
MQLGHVGKPSCSVCCASRFAAAPKRQREEIESDIRVKTVDHAVTCRFSMKTSLISVRSGFVQATMMEETRGWALHVSMFSVGGRNLVKSPS